MRSNTSCYSLLIVSLLAFCGCSPTPSTEGDKHDLRTDSQAAMKAFYADDNTLEPLIQKSYGYAILPTIAKGAVGVGGAYGKGEVFEQGAHVGYTSMSQASFGLQAGGQGYSELLVFQTKEALDKFKTGDFAISGSVSAVAATAGAAGVAKFDNGMAVFVRVNGGLMYEASIAGQKFSYSATETP
jgi:lipid-binding SYLF domain-containing protein